MGVLRVSAILALMAAIGLAGCSTKNGLRQIRSTGEGPDEFKILPSKPLTPPQNYALLPAPTPGGANLVDPDPVGEAIVALGGRPPSATGGIPGSDGALVNHTGRYGVPSNIRASLAEADEQFRKRQARASSIKLFRVDRYQQAYRREALDPFQETWRFRRSGIPTSSAPPQ